MRYARYDKSTGVIDGIFESSNFDNIKRNTNNSQDLIEVGFEVNDADYKVVNGNIVYDPKPIETFF